MLKETGRGVSWHDGWRPYRTTTLRFVTGLAVFMPTQTPCPDALVRLKSAGIVSALRTGTQQTWWCLPCEPALRTTTVGPRFHHQQQLRTTAWKPLILSSSSLIRARILFSLGSKIGKRLANNQHGVHCKLWTPRPRPSTPSGPASPARTAFSIAAGRLLGAIVMPFSCWCPTNYAPRSPSLSMDQWEPAISE